MIGCILRAFLLPLLLGLFACGSSKDQPASSAAPVSPTAPVSAVSDAAPPDAAPARPVFHLQLRSTPAGAEAALDGRPAGRTPVIVDVPDDGKEHELTFLLGGYALERYRTRPVQSGVVHARLRAVPHDLDAGL